MSARAAADGVVQVDELTEITTEDVEPPGAAVQREVRHIGFLRGEPGSEGNGR